MKDEIIINVDENDNEIGFIEKLDAHIKEFSIEQFQYLYLMITKNYYYKKDLVESIIHQVFGPILAVLILIKMKTQKMQQIDV